MGSVSLLLNTWCSTVLKSLHLHMGLAAQLLNEFGSRYLIDTLHLHSVCMSYDDLRRFMTRSAEIEIDSLQEGVCVHNSIVSITDGGYLIHEGDDNVNTITDGGYLIHEGDDNVNINYRWWIPHPRRR